MNLNALETLKLKGTAWFYLALIAFWTVVVSVIGLASLPLNPLSLQHSNQINISAIIPQGWGFFTRDPREDAVLVFKMNDGKYVRINKATGDKSYLFGAYRYARAIGSEVIRTMKQIPDSSWQYIKETGDSLSLRSDSNVVATNNARYPLLLGKYLFVVQQRIPWAWSKRHKSIVMPYKIINVSISRK